MTEHNPAGETGSVEAHVALARRLYADMARALEGVIEGIRAGAGAAGDEKSRAEALRAHHKTLLMLLEFEAKLEKLTPSTANAAGFDLDAAKDEICRRLARQRERCSDCDLSG